MSGFHLPAKIIEDVPYRDVTPPSSSRSLVPAGPFQPADSRVASALAQHARAQRSPPSRDVARIPSGFFAGMNALFAGDPSGDESLFALAAAINKNADAIQSAQERAELDHAADGTRNQTVAAERERQDAARRKKDDIHQAIMMMLGAGSLRGRDDPVDPDREDRLAFRSKPFKKVQPDYEPEEEPEEEPDPLDEIEELPPID